MTSASERHLRLVSMADTVDSLVSVWIGHRVKAGLIQSRTGRYQRGELDYFIAAHGTNHSMRADRRVFAKWLENIGHLGANTRRVHVSTVRGFVSWAAAEGHINPKALALIPRVRGTRSVPRALNGDQAARFVRSLETPKQRVIVGSMLWMGLRCAEVANANVEDINEREATILIVGKGNHERMIPIPPEFAPFLDVWLDYRRRLPGPLVYGREGRYAPTTISTLVSRWMRSSGVKVASLDGRSAHSLRHTAASDMSDGGASLTTVQAMLGHQHLSTTAIYLRRTKLDDLRKAMSGRDYAA